MFYTKKIKSSQNICPSREKVPYKCSNNNTSRRDTVSFVIFRLAAFHLFLPKEREKNHFFILQLLTFKMISNKEGAFEELREGKWEAVVSRDRVAVLRDEKPLQTGCTAMRMHLTQLNHT